MEKKVVILLTIMTMVINIFSFLYINQKTIDKILYDKTTVSFKIHTDKDLPDILTKVDKFSETNKVEIAQYSFLSSNKTDIYSTMQEKYSEALNVLASFSDKKIKVHEFEELLDVGFKNLLYIDTKDEEMIQKFSNELEEECEIQYSLPSSLKNMSFISTNINPLPVFVLFYFLFILIVFFYYSRNRKKIAICRLWGYTHVQIYGMVTLKDIIFSIILSACINGIHLNRNFLFILLIIFLLLNTTNLMKWKIYHANQRRNIGIWLLFSIILVISFKYFFVCIIDANSGSSDHAFR